MNKTTVLAATAIASAFVAYYYYNRYNELATMFKLYNKLSEAEHDLMIKMINELKKENKEEQNSH